MNRREFTRNMLAAAATPALPLPALAKAQAVVVPKAARFWAIYMTHLHGDITPGMLTQMTGIAPAQTTAIRAKLIADNVISPTGFVRKSAAAQTLLRSQKQTEATLSKIKAQAEKTAKLVDQVSERPEDLNMSEDHTPPEAPEPPLEAPQDPPTENPKDI